MNSSVNRLLCQSLPDLGRDRNTEFVADKEHILQTARNGDLNEQWHIETMGTEIVYVVQDNLIIKGHICDNILCASILFPKGAGNLTLSVFRILVSDRTNARSATIKHG